MKNKRQVTLGDVYFMKFSGAGNEQRGWRPGVVIQNNKGNTYSPNIVALPLTTALKKLGQPTHVLVRAYDSGLQEDSMVLCENPRCLSKECIGRYVTTLPEKYMKQIAVAHLLASGLVSFLDADELMAVSNWSILLNSKTA